MKDTPPDSGGPDPETSLEHMERQRRQMQEDASALAAGQRMPAHLMPRIRFSEAHEGQVPRDQKQNTEELNEANRGSAEDLLRSVREIHEAAVGSECEERFPSKWAAFQAGRKHERKKWIQALVFLIGPLLAGCVMVVLARLANHIFGNV